MTLTTMQPAKSEMISFNHEQVALIKNYLCKGITDDELKLFSAVCKKTGLDPFMKQIYAVKRKDQMTIQTSIDGYRLIAERTGRYAPGRESTFTYDKDNNLISATSYIKKMTSDGTWHEIGVTAFFDEYKPSYSNQFWETKKHIMLAKCAESLALRKAFPNELSAVRTEEEMQQADIPTINLEQAQEIDGLISQCSEKVQEIVRAYIKNQLNADCNSKIPLQQYSILKKRLLDTIEKEKIQLEKTGTDNA